MKQKIGFKSHSTTQIRFAFMLLLCVVFESKILAQPYSTQAQLSGSASYYQMNINSFSDFTNGVWSDVYNWDPSRDYTDKKSGNVVGGWKSLEWDNLYFEHYTEYGGYWDGWCPSNRSFVFEGSNPLNQFSATTLGGKDGKETPYLIGYYSWFPGRANSSQFRMKDGVPCVVAGMYVTNLYYSYLSMHTGDGFARKFGKGDWFLLTAYGHDANDNITGTAEFYLADYRSDDSLQRYVVDDWRWFDLTSLGEVSSVEFILSSSDNSEYGMNTPSYFCMDKLTLSLVSVAQQPVSQRACLGDSVAFTAKIVGQDYYNTPRKGKPRVQWRKNGIDIAGANDTILILKNISEADSGSYTCYVLSDYQTDHYREILHDATFKAEALSDPAQLRVVRPISISLQPSDTSVNAGTSAIFAMATLGNREVSYQWYKNKALLTNQTNDTLSINFCDVHNTGRYYCVATSFCNSLTSQQAILTVIPQMNPIEEISLVSLCEESVLHIAPEQNTSQHRYSWSKDGATLPNDTLSYIHKTSLHRADSGEYVCRIYNATATIAIKRYRVSIIPITQIVSPLMSENGSDKTLIKILANGADLQYRWFFYNREIATSDSGSLWVNQKGNYYCQVSGQCGDATSATASITITGTPEPEDELPSLSANHCKAGGTIALNNADGYKLRLMSLNGIIVMETDCTDEHLQLPMYYPQGVYVLQALPSKKASRQYHNPVWKLIVE